MSASDWVRAQRRPVLGAALLVLVVLTLLTSSYWRASGLVRPLIESAGIGAMFLFVIGRVWCALYISGKKSVAVVMDGPYAAVRHPLYVCSIIGAAGIGAVAGSLVLALLFGLACFVIFNMIAAAEEAYMAATHGAAYTDYIAKTPRFLPDPGLWRQTDRLTIRPRLVADTLFDTSWFLVAIPLLKVIAWLHGAGYLAAPLVLP